MNDAWISFWSSISCYTLIRSQSDHYPIMIVMKKGVKSNPSSFKYFSMWADHSKCLDLVKEAWSMSIIGCPMFVLMQKLKNLKAKFKVWNKHVFGDINQNVDNAMELVDQIQQKISDAGFSDSLHEQEVQA